MTDEPLHTLFSAYRTPPATPIPLPSDLAAQQHLFNQARLAIEAALDQTDVTTADQVVAFVWAIAHQTKEAWHTAEAHWCSGLALHHREKSTTLQHLTEARAYFAQAGRTIEEGRLMISCAAIAADLGKLDEAETTLRQAMEYLAPEPNNRNWPALYLNLSYLLWLRGNYEEMLECAHHAEAVAQRFGRPEIQAEALVNQGLSHLSLAQLAEAETAFQAAQPLAADSESVLGRIAVNRARIATYRGELFHALRLLTQARIHFETAQIPMDQATVAIDEARLYERLQMRQEARRAAIAAADTFEQEQLPADSVEARLLAARLALEQEKPTEARAHLQQVESLIDQVAPLWRALLHGYSAHPLLQRTAEQRTHALQKADAAAAELADLQAGSEHLEIALIGAHLSASLRQPDAPQRYREIADAANQHHLVAHEQRACMQHAALLRAPAACPLLRRAADVLVYERQQMPVEELKANLLSGQHVVYARLIEAQIKGRQPLEATQTILESKGGAWIDLATPPRTGDPDPAWLQARETLTKWQEEQRFASEPDYAAYCQQQVQEAETVLVAATRHTARLREPQPLPSVTDVQGHMPHDSILIEYLVGTRHIFACVIASDTRPHWVKLGKVDEITSLSGRTALLLKTLQNSTNSEQRLQTALAQQQALDTQLARLYDLLLAPLESYLPAAGTLILSPDDILFAVPWAALVTPDGYLGERYALTLVPSGAVLGISRQPLDSPTAAPVAFGWAGNPPLHYIQDELTAIQQTMPTLRCVYPASRHQIRWDTAPTWLHIAAHGHIHRQTPLLSWIELADGRLLLVDVLTLNLHGTHLVTLSACDTATLPEQGGILLALAGAFLSVGAQSVLASLWKVDDQATLLLMATFYAALQQAIPLAQALAQAQQEVRRRGYEHPYYWASFQLLTRCAAPSVPISNDSTSTKQT